MELLLASSALGLPLDRYLPGQMAREDCNWLLLIKPGGSSTLLALFRHQVCALSSAEYHAQLGHSYSLGQVTVTQPGVLQRPISLVEVRRTVLFWM